MFRFLPAAAVGLLLAAAAQAGTEVTLNTMFTGGDVTIELYDSVAPATCRNFLTYIYSERYDSSMFHRSADLTDALGNYLGEFILQGGGFYYNGTAWDDIPTDAPVVNEFSISNTRGTVAMAKLGGDPDSATSQFFFNLGDNSANLDNQNGGFTVFAQVTAGMDVIDYIASLPTRDLTSNFYPEPWAGAMGQVPVWTDIYDREYFVQTDVTAPTPHPGDANFDGAVNVYDLAAVANNYGRPGDMSWMDADFNDDDTVNVHDLAILANNYDWTAPAGSPVPEPVALLVLALAAPFALRLHRRPWRRR